jgi:Undecaprenyl-phosphate glucose phosphotransferase
VYKIFNRGADVSEPYAEFSILDEVGPDLYREYSEGQAREALNVSLSAFVPIVACFELLIFTAILMAAGAPVLAQNSIDRTLMICVGIAILLVNLLSANKLYRVEVLASFRQFLRRVTGVTPIALLALVMLYNFGALAEPVGNLALWLIGWCALTVILLTGFRGVVAVLFTFGVRRGIITHNVVLIGTTELAAEFAELIRTQSYGVRVTAIFDHAVLPTTPPVTGDPDLPGVMDFLRYSKRHRIDTVILALPSLEAADVGALIRQIDVQPLRVRLLPGPWARRRIGAWSAPAGELPGIYLIRVSDPPISGFSGLAKTTFDRVVASFALLLFAPLMLLCAVLIKISSPGPVLFRQVRVGYRNKEFNVFKFRTMHFDDCNSGRLTVRDDPRIFGVGRIFRKLSLDELPQLFNVIRGDMSLVGPRPHMPEARAAGVFYHHAVPGYAARHRVKPGITGLAQVSGWRGPTVTIAQIENRVAADIEYINKWSLGLDIKILVKTVFVGFFGKNAF